MPIAFLLALQASGMVIDWLGTREQQRIADLGARVTQSGIEASIQQTRLESEDASLQAMKALRQQMGSQAAIFAARGTNPGAGSAFSLINESLSNFKSDERMRRMNLLGKENELKAGKTISKLNQAGSNTQLWNSFAQRSLQRFPTSPQAFGQAGKSFGLTPVGG